MAQDLSKFQFHVHAILVSASYLNNIAPARAVWCGNRPENAPIANLLLNNYLSTSKLANWPNRKQSTDQHGGPRTNTNDHGTSWARLITSSFPHNKLFPNNQLIEWLKDSIRNICAHAWRFLSLHHQYQSYKIKWITLTLKTNNFQLHLICPRFGDQIISQ